MEGNKDTSSLSIQVVEEVSSPRSSEENYDPNLATPVSCSSAAVANAADVDSNSNSCMHPLPEVSDKYLDRTFYTNGMNVEVTSMDITPHGSFLVAGCSNGSILLYDLTRSEDSGLIIGHITAKGLLTNLTLTVRITEECRFCFAGVQKGSSEMLAIDIGSLPVPWTAPSKLKELALAGQAVLMENVSSAIRTYSHSDAKLRGFASAVRVFSENSSDLTYRLACGKGIKNVHVWQFVPSVTKNGDLSPNLKADWVCIYDVASNGNTITHIEFRNNGMQMLSKSAGVNLRVWDTSNYAGEPTTKANYEDIVNSHDMKCILAGKFALGGTYEFAVLNVDAPREANRDVFEMPERPIAGDEAEIQYSTGLRRRRTMREIDDIISTDNGSHALILCTDGGVMYYSNPVENIIVKTTSFTESSHDYGDKPNSELESSDEVSHAETHSFTKSSLFLELSNIQRNQETDQSWHLKRVGANGAVALLRACRQDPNAMYQQSVITVRTLADQFQNDLKDGFHDCGLLNFPAAGRFFNGFNHTGNTPIVKKQNTSAPQKKTESTKKKAKLPPSGNKLKVDRSAEAMPYTTPGVRVVEGQKSRSNLPDAPEKIRQHNKIAISPRTIESSTGDHNINRLVSSSASTPIAKTPIRQENSSPETREDAESADVRENSRIRYRSDNKRQKVDGSSVTAAVANASTNVDKTLPDMHQDLQLYNSISAIYMPHKRLYEPLKIGPPPKVRRVGIVDFQLPAVLNEPTYHGDSALIKWQEKLQSKYNCLQQELNSSLARKRPSPEYLKSVTHSKLQSIWIQQERLHQTCVNDIIAIRKIQKDVSKVNEKISITAAHLKAIINERLKFYKADLLGALDFDRISSGQIGDQDFSLKLLAQSQYNRILFKLAGNSIEMQYCHEYFFDSLQLFK